VPAAEDGAGGEANRIAVRFAPGDAVAPFAARGLASRLAAMLGEPVAARPAAELEGSRIALELGPPGAEVADGGSDEVGASAGDSYRIAGGARSITIVAGSGRALLHGVGDLFEELGASFAPWRDPEFPHLERAQLHQIAARRVTPAFERRAFASDLMTWHYENSARLEEHLAHDRLFIPWMTARGMNALMFIRHGQDTRVRIDGLAPLLERFQVEAEYGGHLGQLLMPRGLFASHPEYFAVDADGVRATDGNFCVSNRDALAIVRDNALAYVRDYPENRMLHVWGADLKDGGWCRCAGCAALSPQLQYMKVVDAVARSLADSGVDIPVAYLAYHDTLEPDAALKPRENVWFEWAPRERCYAHPIDDPACPANRGYFPSLQRYLEIFAGRGTVFEYYADAILFGGLSFATPNVIVRDLQAYHRIGIRSVSCLTFGAFSVFAYPLNLETFARATRSLGYAPEAAAAEIARTRHPRCAVAVSDAYRAVERASGLVLRYGDVLRPFNQEARAARGALHEAYQSLADGVAAADHLMAVEEAPRLAAERELWRLSRDALAGLADYVAACAAGGDGRRAAGEAAIRHIEAAMRRMGPIAAEFKGTWGSYDFERLMPRWLDSLRRHI